MRQPGRRHRQWTVSRRTLLRSAVYSTLALTGSVAYGQSDNLEVIKVDVPIAGLPSSCDGFSVGVMADFHAGAWGNREVIAGAISSMQQLRPDCITLLGDYIDGARSHGVHTIDKGKFLFPQLQSLKAPFGVYAVLGNHDHWADSRVVAKLLQQRNILVLKNEHTVLANGLIIAGVDDYWEGPGDAGKALAGIRGDSPVILLSHNPDINEDLGNDNAVRLILAGHTHGGQVRVPFTGWAPWVPCHPRYKGRSGLFRETEKRWGFISKGVGSFLLPVRLSCPPDIALLTLKAV